MSISAMLCVLVLLMPSVLALSVYRDRIPNGHHVPHPCNADVFWRGVGHHLAAGSRSRNPFGEAFQAASHSWTEDLCNADSDEDGVTNGEELGDPGCIWVMGQEPTVTNGITHPGVCEPIESPQCQAVQPSFTCDGAADGYDCPSTEEDHVQFIDLRNPVTEVPAEETTYYCTTFQLPADQQYHAIGYEPIIDNVNVMHHMLMFGCDDTVTSEQGPSYCGMSDIHCQSLLLIWTVGLDGQCMREDVGLRFGNGSFTHFSLQIHWNNPLLIEDSTDSSGMKLYFTPQLRTYDQQIAQLGQTDLMIPPRTKETIVEGLCPAECTQKMSHSVNITSAIIHMHYLGQSGKAELFRNGEHFMDILDDREYNYESPIIHHFDPPLELLPGDSIKTICRFNTLDGTKRRDNIVKFGESTQAEMCFTYLFYYPAIDGFHCTEHGEFSPCEGGECDFDTFSEEMEDMITYLSITGICSATEGCSDDCFGTFVDVFTNHCFRKMMYFVKKDPENESNLYIQFYLDVYRRCLTRYLEGDPPAAHSTTPRQPVFTGNSGTTIRTNSVVIVGIVINVIFHY